MRFKPKHFLGGPFNIRFRDLPRSRRENRIKWEFLANSGRFPYLVVSHAANRSGSMLAAHFLNNLINQTYLLGGKQRQIGPGKRDQLDLGKPEIRGLPLNN